MIKNVIRTNAHLVINHADQVLHIETSRGDRCRDEQTNVAALKVGDRRVAVVL